MSQKKKNPKNFPATVDEVEQRHREGVSAGTDEGLMSYMSVMRDKHGYGQKRLMRVWNCCQAFCDKISNGKVLLPALAQKLDAITIEPICPLMHDPLSIYTKPIPPVSQADVKRGYRKGKEAGRQFATLIFSLALNESEGFKGEKLRTISREVAERLESIEQRYVKASDLQQVLEDEVHIEFVAGG